MLYLTHSSSKRNFSELIGPDKGDRVWVESVLHGTQELRSRAQYGRRGYHERGID
jgi:hypothetical protein